MSDIFDIYDKHRRPTGRTIRRGTPLADGEYRMAVQVWIQNTGGQWLISRRSANKSQPLKWEPTGGCVLSGETSLQATVREVREELGIALVPESGVLFATFCRSDPCWENPGFLDIWVFHGDFSAHPIVLQPGETCDARWATADEICSLIASGEFVPSSEYAYHPHLLNCDHTGLSSVRIARIRYMESLLDCILSSKNTHMRKELDILESYYHSPLWQADYTADEAGLLPPDLKRGVLSQDAIYDLLISQPPFPPT